MPIPLVTQRAVRMRRFVLRSVTCLAAPRLSTLSHKKHNLKKKKRVIGYKTRDLIFSTILSEMFLIPKRIERDTYLHTFLLNYLLTYFFTYLFTYFLF